MDTLEPPQTVTNGTGGIDSNRYVLFSSAIPRLTLVSQTGTLNNCMLVNLIDRKLQIQAIISVDQVSFC